MSIRWIYSGILLALLCPIVSFAATGKVVYVENEATVMQEGQVIPVTTGMDISASAAMTGAKGNIQLRMSDGTLIALSSESEIRFTEGQEASLSLVRGGIRLTTPSPKISWLVQAQGRDIRASGYLKLQNCAAGCTQSPGLYGRGSGGETVVEYVGGRSVLRGKVFRLPTTGGRPEILVNAPSLLDGVSNHEQADLARAEVIKRLTLGQEAFREGKLAIAKEHLEAVQAAAPSETIVSYYLGLIALDSQKNDEALRLLQKFMKDDPHGAVERDVPKTITLLSTQQLQDEVANAISQEKSLSAAKPEPNSIAVQTFSSRGDPVYQSMAKGIAAMIIADLKNVPGLTVLEREKVQKLMDEMGLGESGLTDESTAVRAGRMMRAEKVIVGSFGVKQ